MILDTRTPAFRQNPHPIYERIRAENPVLPVKGVPAFVNVPQIFASRYDDVMSVLKDPRFTVESRKVGGRDLSKAWWLPGLFRAFLNTMVMADEPDHTRLRAPAHIAFTPRRIREIEQHIETLVGDLLMGVRGQQTIDLIPAFGLPVPLNVISEMLGVPEAWRYDFHRLIETVMGHTSSNTIAGYAQRIWSANKLNGMFKKLIDLRRNNPQDDILSALIRAADDDNQMTAAELSATVYVLLFAGYETTVNLIGNGVLALLQNPDQLDLLKSNPDLIDDAIEEMLRYTGSVQMLPPHYALEALELGGVQIEKGSAIICGIGSANRDTSAFENPDTFDMTRTPNKHLGLGFGAHYCLGAPLARMEAKVAFRMLFEYFPDLALDVAIDDLAWRGAPVLRGPKSLRVRLNG